MLARYLLRRLLQAVFVLWAAFTVSFVILYALPSDPVALVAGTDATDITAEQLDALRAEYGLDRPLVVQYLDQLGDAARGDLGRSVQSGRPVTTLIAEALPATLQIAAAGLALAVRRRRRPRPHRHVHAAGVAAPVPARACRRSASPCPSFWVGLVLLQQFSFERSWFPAVGNEGWRSIVLPAITLALPTGAQIAQLLAKSLETTLHEPYIDTARAKGASRARVHVRHALRNAALPALTMAGLLVGALLSGTVVTETVFSRSGLGRLTASAVSAQDIPVVQGLVLFGAAVFVVVNLAVDLVYPLLDPRIVRRRPAAAGATRRRPGGSCGMTDVDLALVAEAPVATERELDRPPVELASAALPGAAAPDVVRVRSPPAVRSLARPGLALSVAVAGPRRGRRVPPDVAGVRRPARRRRLGAPAVAVVGAPVRHRPARPRPATPASSTAPRCR